LRGGIGPRQQVIDLAVRVAIDDPGDDVGEVGVRLSPMSLQVRISEAMTAQCSPPPSEPANMAFLRLSAIGRMARSTTLESISMRPSSMKRVSLASATVRIGWLL
jgi:hypothetical protein